jgi:hypothetical protein
MKPTPHTPKAPWFRLLKVTVFKPTFDEFTMGCVGGMFIWLLSLGMFWAVGWKIDVKLAAIVLVWSCWSTVSTRMGLQLGPLTTTWRKWVVFGFIGLHLLVILDVLLALTLG